MFYLEQPRIHYISITWADNWQRCIHCVSSTGESRVG